LWGSKERIPDSAAASGGGMQIKMELVVSEPVMLVRIIIKSFSKNGSKATGKAPVNRGPGSIHLSTIKPLGRP
jgi:hypothetical protein